MKPLVALLFVCLTVILVTFGHFATLLKLQHNQQDFIREMATPHVVKPSSSNPPTTL